MVVRRFLSPLLACLVGRHGTHRVQLVWYRFADSGWVGFGIACVAALGSYVLPTVAGVKPEEDHVVLDSRLLNNKGDAYQNVLDRFANGASLIYDGVAFGFRPNNEIACGIVAISSDLDDDSARETADHAQSVFDHLSSASPEFASLVAGRTFRISIVSGFDHDARELCRIVNGSLEWKRVQ